MPFKHQEHSVSPAYGRGLKHIGDFIAVFFYFRKGEYTFLILSVQPDQRPFIRLFISYCVHNVIAEIEICRIIKGKAF